MHQIRKTNYTVVIVSLFFVYSEGGTCQTRPRAYKTKCENCKASRYCSAIAGSEPPVSPGICNDTCLSHGSCQMVQYHSEDDICDMYDCTEVDMGTGYSTNRLSCRSDCFLYETSFFAGYIGICPTLRTYRGQPSVERCLSLCLDLNGCKGSTFWRNGSCHLHHCTNIETSDTTGVSFFGYSCLDVPTTTILSIPSTSNVLQVSTTYSSELRLEETSLISLSQKAVSTFASSQLPEANKLPSSSHPADSLPMHTTTQPSQAHTTKIFIPPFQVSSMLMSFPPSQERSTLSSPQPPPTTTEKVSSSQLDRTLFTRSLMQNLSNAPVTHSETQTSLSQQSEVPSLLSSTQPPVHQSTEPSDIASYTTSIKNGITVQATAFWTKTTSPTTTLASIAKTTNQTDPNNEEGIFDNPTNVAAAASVGGVAAGLAVGVGVQVLKAKQCDTNTNTVV